MANPNVLIVGGTPPPVVGTTLRIEMLVNHPLFRRAVHYDLLDTVDRRTSDNMGRLELTNVVLGVRHVASLFWKLLRNRYSVAFLSIAQNKWAFLRDSIFIWLCSLFRVRVVVHLDGGHFRQFYLHQSAIFRKYIEVTCRRVSTGIVLGRTLRFNFEGLISNVETIHAGVPVIGSGRRNGEIKRVLFLSSLYKSKGYLDVLRSVKYVVEPYPRVRFVFVGNEGKSLDDPKDYNVSLERETIIREDQIGDYVSLLGPLFGEDRDNEFRKADIFVFPSFYIYEGKPAVVLQAMSAELPIVTTRFPGAEDLIEDGVNGFFVPPHDPKAIASKIVLLLKDPDLRHRMGKANRNKIEREYNVDDHVQKTIEVLMNHKQEERAV